MKYKPLSSYYDEFLSFLSVEKNVSSYTIANYKSDFKKFNEFIAENDISPELANMLPPLFRRYIHYLKENDYKPSSIRRKINSLRSFFNYLCLAEYIDNSPLKRIVIPSKEKRLPNYFNEQQINLLLNTAKRSTRTDALRDYILLKLIVSTGIRRQEAVDLNFSHIDFQNRTIRIRGKGNKERMVPIKEEFCDELWMYMQSRLPLINQALFITRTGNRIHASRCHTIFTDILKEVGLDGKGLSLHSLRHSYATILVSNGAPIQVVQQLLGHQSVSTTTIYAHTSAENLKEAIEKLPY